MIASLHRSNWDSLAVGVRLPRRMRPMAKIELMRAPVLGWFLRHGGAFPVRRGETDTQAIASALSILRAGGLLLMFPEGTRNRDGTAVVQPGAARIALQGKAAIVPVAVLNTDRPRLFPPRFPQFRVAYGPPLDLSDLEGTPLKVAAVEATARWQAAVAALRRSLGSRPRARAPSRARSAGRRSAASPCTSAFCAAVARFSLCRRAAAESALRSAAPCASASCRRRWRTSIAPCRALHLADRE